MAVGIDSADATPEFQRGTNEEIKCAIKGKLKCIMVGGVRVLTKQSTMILRKQNDMPSDRLILAMDYIEAGGIIALTHDDGSIVFFDVKTMKHAAHVGDSSNTVISIVQAGYTFPPSSPGMV